MSEEKEETKITGTNETEDDSGTGTETKNFSDLDRAEGIAKMQKEENDRRLDILARETQLEASRRVGGETAAGKTLETKKEESNHDYRMRINKEMAAGKTDFGS